MERGSEHESHRAKTAKDGGSLGFSCSQKVQGLCRGKQLGGKSPTPRRGEAVGIRCGVLASGTTWPSVLRRISPHEKWEFLGKKNLFWYYYLGYLDFLTVLRIEKEFLFSSYVIYYHLLLILFSLALNSGKSLQLPISVPTEPKTHPEKGD